MTDRRLVIGALLADMALTVVFVVIGRREHDSAGAFIGFLITLWPFVAALGVGWLVTRAWRRPTAPLTGVLLWPIVVVVGMLLRAVSDQGTAWSFILVTALVLGAFLIGWRLAVAGIHRFRVRSRS
ncbi:DUF3054 domain-containing protein [Diaminobutyricimonas sp. TR449]|uniref:DUF3054 domain-containing protein n=1 Tax=Diaminobutyricimonas sp. TR449 TaxID=2708076 RepID=UPI00141FC4A8|nr:DUF3054 domain-containing protein [Diaminobutyricimonas sp. TR449]